MPTTTITTASTKLIESAGLNFWIIPFIFIGVYTFAYFIIAISYDKESSLMMLMLGALTGTMISYVAGIVPIYFLILELIPYFAILWRGGF